MPRRWPISALAGLLLLACALGAHAQALTLRGVEFPETLGGYRRGKVQTTTRSSGRQGSSVAYSGKTLAAAVFVYGAQNTQPEDDLDPKLLRDEFKELLQAEEQEAKRRSCSLVVRGMQSLDGPGHEARFLEAELLLSKGKEQRPVYLYLGWFRGQYLKIMAGGGSNVSNARAARNFVQALARKLWPTPVAAPQESTP